MSLQELQGKLVFSTDIQQIKANVAILREYLQQLETHKTVVRGLLQAVYECCPHKNQTTYSDPRDWGGTCHDCGKTW